MPPRRQSSRIASAALAKSKAESQSSIATTLKRPAPTTNRTSPARKKKKTTSASPATKFTTPKKKSIIQPSKVTPSPITSKETSESEKSSNAESPSIFSPANQKKQKSHPVDKDIECYYSYDPNSDFTVVKNENEIWYDVVLNQCNITGSSNNNKYYRIQMLKHNATSRYFVWLKWGRVGEASTGRDLKGPFLTEEAALPTFEKKYKDKTGNKFDAETFVPKKGKYVPLEIDNDVEVNEDAFLHNKGADSKDNVEYLPSKLVPVTKELVDVLFSKEMRNEALTSFNLDLKRLPLGVPSQQQIQRGISILNIIDDKLSGSDISDSYNELSSQFYTAIPHSFGRSRPPSINNAEHLQKRYDMCNILLDMFATNETINNIEKGKKETKKVPCPADSYYDSMKAHLDVIDKKSKEFKMIKTYFEKTKGHDRMKLFDVWSVDRHGEEERYKEFECVENRRLLWHGTNIAVVAPIITSGLRIMPHSGGRVGSGIYLASMQEKSAWYTS
mmetsp:Transcript_32923/g.40429  ORF Transcript_32923/g.40429 Transcript_32923/m.40429 type:complete len:502 (-) Transcript_32923:365-1870(-)